ncbi:MAG: hypothetical protein JSR54_09175 [Proteobacteria bacterium]|nr:hypothetical protein [Pseudomonadota bacterium]
MSDPPDRSRAADAPATPPSLASGALATVACAGLAFALDLATPRGYVDGLVYVVPVAVSLLVGTRRALFVTAGVVTLLDLAADAWCADAVPPVPWTLRLTDRLVSIAVVWLVTLLLQTQIRYRAIAARYARLRELSARLASADEANRAQLSRWLHEEIAQQLVAVRWGLEALGQQAPDGAARTTTERLQRLLVESVEFVRATAVRLRPPALSSLGLRATVAGHVDAYRRASGVDVRFDGGRAWDAVPPELAETFYRVVQFALTDLARAGDAANVVVDCRADCERVTVTIAADGSDPATAPEETSAWERLALRERLAAAGGDVFSESRDGRRWIEAHAPLAA